MTAQDLAILVTIVFGGASALLVVTSRNVVHAALYLVVTLLSAAATFLLLGAEFLAWTQVLVYVGAVVVLILFGLMLTRAPIGPMAVRNENAPLALAVSVGLFFFLSAMILRAFGDTVIELRHTPALALGEVLYIAWAFPFIVLGFFLTAALIGAVVIARSEVGEGPAPDEEAVVPEPREPAFTDASANPGVTQPSQEVGV
jgi:NADH-quinone oxidoreductase subunit J